MPFVPEAILEVFSRTQAPTELETELAAK